MATRQRYIIATVCAVVGLVAAIGAPVKFESLSFLRPTATEFQLQPHVNGDGSASVVLEGLRPGEVPLFNQHTMVNLYGADRSIATAVDFGGLEALGIDNPMFRGQTWTPSNSGGQEFKVLTTTKTPDTVAALIDYRSLYVPTKPLKIVALRQSSLSDFAPLITDFLPFMTGQNCFSALQRGDFLTTRCPEFVYQAPYKLDYNPSSRALTITPTHHQMWDTLKVYEQGVVFTYGKDPFGPYMRGNTISKIRLAANLPRAVNNLGGFVMQAGSNGNGGNQGAEDSGINTQDASQNGEDDAGNREHKAHPCDDLLRTEEITKLEHQGLSVVIAKASNRGEKIDFGEMRRRCTALIAQNMQPPFDPNKACPGVRGCPKGCSGGCELERFDVTYTDSLDGIPWNRSIETITDGHDTIYCKIPDLKKWKPGPFISWHCSLCESLVSSSSDDSATSSSSANETSEESTTSTSSESVSHYSSESSTSQASSTNQAEPINTSSSKSSDAEKSTSATSSPSSDYAASSEDSASTESSASSETGTTTSNDNSSSSEGWNSSADIQRKCYVLVVEGIDCSGKLIEKISKIKTSRPWHFQPYGCTQNAETQGKRLASGIQNILSAAQENGEGRPRISVYSHSLGAIAAFNYRQEEVEYNFYDPPYAVDYGPFAPIFSTNMKEITKAAKDGIASVCVDWTKGLTTPAEDHTPWDFNKGFAGIDDSVKSWIESNCPEN